MRVKPTDATQYGHKLTLLFLLVGISAVLAPAWSGKMAYDAVMSIRQSIVLAADEKSALALFSAVKGYSGHAEKTESLLSSLKSAVYSPQNLQSAIAEELLKSNLTVETFSVRNVTDKAKTIPARRTVWKNFNFAAVSLSGTINTDKLADFMLFLATAPKLWYISALEIRPMDSPAPAELVSRFRSVETEITPQGRTFEKNSVLDSIAKRTNKNTLSVSLTFFVPIETEGGLQ
jgi:hypothetical protein